MFNLCSFCFCFALTMFGVIKLTFLTVSYFYSSKDSQAYIKQEQKYSNGTTIVNNITQQDGPVSEEWKEAETYWNQVIEPVGWTIIVFLFHLVIFLLFIAGNVVLLYFMMEGMLKARYSQGKLIKLTSASVGKLQIIFSFMTLYMLFFYALVALDAFLLLPPSYHPEWLAAMLTPNIKIIVLGQLSALMVLSQMTEEDRNHGNE